MKMIPRHPKVFLCALSTLAWTVPLPGQSPSPPPLPPPPQNQGLPYTRSSIAAGLAILGNRTAVMPGSRYGYVDGRRVRLSESDLLRAEAVLRDGKIYVPREFAALIAPGRGAPPPVPPELSAIADRWVYAPSDFGLADASLPGTFEEIQIAGRKWVALDNVAASLGLKVSRLKSGIVLVGDPLEIDPAAEENLITLFDTPDKFAQPGIATRHIPNLKRQGAWTDHVRVTEEQLALLNGPPTPWQPVPADRYDFEGFNAGLLGSKVPLPGIYPRLFFSPEDLPSLRRRIASTVSGQKTMIEMEEILGKTWFDTATDDGRLFDQLAGGNLDGLSWPVVPGKPAFAAPHLFESYKPGVYSSHTAYVPECLTAIALYALIKDDDQLGRKVASAISNYYRLREPLLDSFLAISDSEFGSSLQLGDGSILDLNAAGARTHWRDVHGIVAHQNLAQALDFAGKWMTDGQKRTMQRFIAKATYGRRSHGQDGPVRFRDVNWMAWDLTHFLAVASIEGLPGFDPEAFQSGLESVRAFCQWGIDPDGVIFESNGKTGGGLQFLTLSMVAAARRTNENLFGHPHWRRLLHAQVQMTSPDGKVVVNSGTQFTRNSREKLSIPFVNQLKAFYPESRLADYLITTELQRTQGAVGVGTLVPDSNFDPDRYRSEVASTKRVRLASASYPGFVRSILFDADVTPTNRSELGLPLNFSAPVHGVFSAYSSLETDAAWINLMVRPNHYLGAGHHHADAGLFHFSALGVNWITESPFTQWYTGNVHNLVTIDGRSMGGLPETPGILYNAPGAYLGANLAEEAASATADLTYAYSWRWNTQPQRIWPAETNLTNWEMDPSPAIAKVFAGTARMKLRPWWPNYNASNYIATSRAPFNPVQYVFRTTGLVRGAYPFAFVVDDVKKDEADRHYQWTAMLNGGVWRAEVAGLPSNALALATTGTDNDLTKGGTRPPLIPKTGDPILLVVALGIEAPEEKPLITTETVDGLPDRKGTPQFMDRLVINQNGNDAAFRVLLIPFRAGGSVPRVLPRSDGFVVENQGESTELTFGVDEQFRTKTTVVRNGRTLLKDNLVTPSPGLPPGFN